MFFNLEIAVARFLAAKQIAEYLRSQKPLIMDVIELRQHSEANAHRSVTVGDRQLRGKTTTCPSCAQKNLNLPANL